MLGLSMFYMLDLFYPMLDLSMFYMLDFSVLSYHKAAQFGCMNNCQTKLLLNIAYKYCGILLCIQTFIKLNIVILSTILT